VSIQLEFTFWSNHCFWRHYKYSCRYLFSSQFPASVIIR